MNGYDFTLSGARMTARPSGALWWRDEGLLAVSDLHLGKSERLARGGGALLPPYETRETLARLAAEIAATEPRTVLCLGDSFDDLAAADSLDAADSAELARLMAGRRWLWVEGNHDPGPVELGGTHLAEHRLGPLTFRHVASPGARGEVSGHYHPKARLSLRGQAISRPCFLVDAARVILPAFGAYTGGLRSDDPAFGALMGPRAVAVLTGPRATAIPMPRRG
jgi:DNA ligase-associated metallophosphoesterase